jgi:hypothetical protein
MKTHIIKNGDVKLILTPESEIEKMLLQDLFKQEVTVQSVEKIQVLNTALVDSVIISAKMLVFPKEDIKSKEDIK